jgi:hypothetical protein
MALDAKRVHVVGKILNESLARLGDVYAVEIEQIATGFEWVRVGEELSAAMEECAKEVTPSPASLPSDHDELVEA